MSWRCVGSDAGRGSMLEVSKLDLVSSVGLVSREDRYEGGEARLGFLASSSELRADRSCGLPCVIFENDDATKASVRYGGRRWASKVVVGGDGGEWRTTAGSRILHKSRQGMERGPSSSNGQKEAGIAVRSFSLKCSGLPRTREILCWTAICLEHSSDCATTPICSFRRPFSSGNSLGAPQFKMTVARRTNGMLRSRPSTLVTRSGSQQAPFQKGFINNGHQRPGADFESSKGLRRTVVQRRSKHRAESVETGSCFGALQANAARVCRIATVAVLEPDFSETPRKKELLSLLAPGTGS